MLYSHQLASSCLAIWLSLPPSLRIHLPGDASPHPADSMPNLVLQTRCLVPLSSFDFCLPSQHHSDSAWLHVFPLPHEHLSPEKHGNIHSTSFLGCMCAPAGRVRRRQQGRSPSLSTQPQSGPCRGEPRSILTPDGTDELTSCFLVSLATIPQTPPVIHQYPH